MLALDRIYNDRVGVVPTGATASSALEAPSYSDVTPNCKMPPYNNNYTKQYNHTIIIKFDITLFIVFRIRFSLAPNLEYNGVERIFHSIYTNGFL